jgi:CSLREA domain-containing protein
MRRRVVRLLTVMTVALVTVASPAWATTFTVNSTADTGDTTPDGACNTCTLREAIQEANTNANAPTVDVIEFEIPGAGPHTISPVSELPDIEEPVTIDGYTETGAIPNTLAFGTNAAPQIVISGASALDGSRGFAVVSGPTTIRGLVINGFQQDNSGLGGDGIVFFNQSDTINNVVEGNFIGTNAAGTTAVPNEEAGVIIFGPGSTGNTIGGTTPAARNLIAGNDREGVVFSNSDANTVRGNLIGTTRTGTGDLGNTEDGVRMINGSNNVVRDNVVAFNDESGVEVLDSSSFTNPIKNRILTNSIFSNAGKGIDLEDSAAGDIGREQDPKDPDVGPNNLQNFPVITSAKSSGTATTIKGRLNSNPNRTFTVQFFSNPAFTDEGKTFLGQVSVKTNDLGKVSFSMLGPAVPTGEQITATATGANSTSEFSDGVAVTPAS